MSTESKSPGENPPPSRHRLARVGVGDRVREWWFPIRRWELGGRLWEALGFRRLYLLTANMAGEVALPGLREGPTELSPEAVEEIRCRSRYHEWANVVLFMTYFPGLVAGVLIGNVPFLLLHIVLAGVNFSCILIERYKRTLALRLQRDGQMGDQPIPSVRAPEKPSGDWYFAPKGWESEALYRRTGVAFYKEMLVDGVTVCRYPPAERTTDAKFMEGNSLEDLLGLENTTRVAESIHLAAFLGRLGIAIAFWGIEFGIDLYFVAFLILDLYFVLVQRYHRLRVWKVVQRYRTRRAAREPGGAPAGSST